MQVNICLTLTIELGDILLLSNEDIKRYEYFLLNDKNHQKCL